MLDLPLADGKDNVGCSTCRHMKKEAITCLRKLHAIGSRVRCFAAGIRVLKPPNHGAPLHPFLPRPHVVV